MPGKNLQAYRASPIHKEHNTVFNRRKFETSKLLFREFVERQLRIQEDIERLLRAYRVSVVNYRASHDEGEWNRAVNLSQAIDSCRDQLEVLDRIILNAGIFGITESVKLEWLDQATGANENAS